MPLDRKVVATGIYEALEQAFRKRMPHVFRRVDVITHAPFWLPWWERNTGRHCTQRGAR